MFPYVIHKKVSMEILLGILIWYLSRVCIFQVEIHDLHFTETITPYSIVPLYQGVRTAPKREIKAFSGVFKVF